MSLSVSLANLDAKTFFIPFWLATFSSAAHLQIHPTLYTVQQNRVRRLQLEDLHFFQSLTFEAIPIYVKS